MNRRAFLQWAACAAAGTSLAHPAAEKVPSPSPLGPGRVVWRLETDAERPLAPVLSWDTEGGQRVQTNLLRDGSPLTLRVLVDGEWHSAAELTSRSQYEGKREYHLISARDAELLWTVRVEPDRLVCTFSAQGKEARRVHALQLVMPFEPGVTPTTVLPSEWAEDSTFRLPAVLSAADYGQVLLADSAGQDWKGRLVGSRAERRVDVVLQLLRVNPETTYRLEWTPVWLPPPQQLSESTSWASARRGWFNIWQPSAEWGEQGRPFSSPAGLLANNVISDPASMSLWFYADLALWTPEIAPGISVMPLVRRTVEWWLDKRTRPTGEVIGYWDYGNFLDANTGPLIAAWDYVEAMNDRAWLARCIEQLEFIADFLARRDIDGDGLVEATQSGNRGTLRQPARSCSWWHALNSGHKDAYTNALIYRAWCCLADLEAKLERNDRRERYLSLASHLRSAYAPALYNPKTGILGWWRSADGELHDYWSPVVNGLAIEYGLVEPELGRAILARLWDKLKAVGFTRFYLGVPPMLVPVHRSDYLLPDAIGCPKREDGTDTFGQYMNGGITACHVLHFLAAQYVVGQPEKADRVLRAMLARQSQGGFQNGVRNKRGEGIDWTTWDGKPSGYEGYLADVYFFLQAVLLREPFFLSKYLRPLASGKTVLNRIAASRSLLGGGRAAWHGKG